MIIDVCIPCVYPHIVYLDKCISSIAAQTLLPSAVIVAVSSIPDELAKKCCHTLLSDLAKKTGLTILYELSSDTRYAGENRNVAVGKSLADIVTFIDADDIMHKNRLEILVKCMQEDSIIGVMHHFYENILPHNDNIVFSPDKLEKYRFSFMIHFGHGTFRRRLFDAYQYTNKKRGQDVEFIHNILREHEANLRVYTEPLTYYYSVYSSAKLNL